MSQVLVGTTANDGTGDPLRTAFQKLDQGKTEWFNVMYYGAKGDNSTNDQPAIQAAINAAGVLGGTVYVPTGNYVIGDGTVANPPGVWSVLIPSNVYVVMDANAVIVRNVQGGAWVNSTFRNKTATGGDKNIKIIGGQFTVASSLMIGKHIGLKGCSNSRVVDVTIVKGYGDWNTLFIDCVDLILSGIIITSGVDNPAFGTDGIHIAGGDNIQVVGCDVSSGDDAFVISGYSGGEAPTLPTTDVSVSGCHFNSFMGRAVLCEVLSGLTLSINRVNIAACSLERGTSQSGPGILIHDGTHTGLVTDVSIKDCTLKLTGSPASQDGVDVDGAVRTTLNIKIPNCTTVGINIDGVGTTDTELIDCFVGPPTAAATCNVVLASTTAINNTRIRGGRYRGATQNIIQVGVTGVATGTEINGVVVDSPATLDGIAVANGVDTTITGCRMENCRFGVNIAAASARTQIVGNDLHMGTNFPINDLATDTIKARNRWNTGPAMGSAVLVAGTVTVTTAEVVVLAQSFNLTCAIPGGIPGQLSIGTVTDRTSFVINSSSPLDTSTVNWEIIH